MEIRGTLEGDCQTSARCVVHEGGRVLGNIEAAALVVAGKVEGGLLEGAGAAGDPPLVKDGRSPGPEGPREG